MAVRLPTSAGPAGRYRTAWWTGTWLGYLRWAADQAARPEFGGEPDRVEMALFTGSWTPGFLPLLPCRDDCRYAPFDK